MALKMETKAKQTKKKLKYKTPTSTFTYLKCQFMTSVISKANKQEQVVKK